MASLVRSICTACGCRGVPKRRIQGSFAIEIVLWICFFVPGLIYSIWRSGSRYEACGACGRPTMIPAISPNGQALVASAGGWTAAAEDEYRGAVKRKLFGDALKTGIALLFCIAFASHGNGYIAIPFAVYVLFAAFRFSKEYVGLRASGQSSGLAPLVKQ